MPSEIVEAFDKLRRDQPERKLVYLPARGEAFSTVESGTAQCASVTHCAPPERAMAGLCCPPSAIILRRSRFCLPAVPNLYPCSRSMVARRPRKSAALAAEFGARVAILPEGRELPGFVNPITQPGLVVVKSGLEAATPAHSTAAVLKLTSGSTGLARAALAPESALVSDGTTLAAAMDIKPTTCKSPRFRCRTPTG